MKTVTWHNLTFSLVAEGDSNWDYYQHDEKDLTVAWPKPGKAEIGCKPSFFGSKKYLQRHLERKEIKKLFLTSN